MTAIKVDTSTRDLLRDVAERDGVTMDSALRRLLRREWLQQAAAELVARGISGDEQIVMNAADVAAIRSRCAFRLRHPCPG
jgi:hypothetical protein